MSVAQEINDSYIAGKLMGKRELGEEISDIINQKASTYGKIEKIVELLKQYKIYKEKV